MGILSRCGETGRELLYRALLRSRGTERREITSPRLAFKNSSDRYWFWLLSRGWQVRPALREVLPGLPEERIQQNWTGSTGDATLREGYKFYCLVREVAAKYQRDLHPETRMLDFGCGWGRIIRFFLRDIEHRNLVGCDCYREALEAARQQNKWCEFRLVEPMPPSPFEAASFDVIYLYSVFSHMSEEAHLRWLGEFQRILKPGGLMFVTTRKRDFILRCAELRRRVNVPEDAQGAMASFSDTEGALRKYDSGDYCHSATGGGGVLDASFYGETCIPRTYVEREWTKMFRLLEFLDNDPRCPQVVIAAEKPRHVELKQPS